MSNLSESGCCRNFCSFALYLLVMLIMVQALSGTARAQTTNATLTGTVVDQNNAAVVGAETTVINKDTGLQRSTITNESGDFIVPLLQPGKYSLRVQHAGFSPVEFPEVVLNVGDQKAVRIELKAGNISEMVQVTGDAPLLNESPAVSIVVDRQFVANIPLNGRSFQTLIALAPGVVFVPSSTTGNSGQFSVNGQRANANYFSVDGVSANLANGNNTVPGQTTSGTLPALTTFGGTNSLVSVEALQEFQIQTSSYSAEYGRSPGGQISLVTRSGGNDVHGSIFDYIRNDKFDANNWFANRAGTPRPPERQNDFGAVFSGPVLLPRFGEGGNQLGYNGRNHTFFFFSYEGLRLRTPKFAKTNVPSINLRQSSSEGMKPILNGFPLPNGVNLANGFAEFSAGYSDANTLNATSIRIDHTVNDKLTLFGRYNYAPSSSSVRDGQSNLSVVTLTKSNVETVTLGASMFFRAVTNELRANYSDNKGHFLVQQDNFGGAIPTPREVLLPPQFAPAGSHWNAGVTFALSSGLSTAFFPQVSLNDSAASQRQINLTDQLSLSKGSHRLKFGIDYRRLTPILSPRAYILALAFTSQANILSGIAPAASIGAGLETRPIYNELSLFAQDSWKLSRRFTVDFGLRWDHNPAPTEANGNDPPAISGLDNLSTMRLAPVGTALWKSTYNNFAPRFGASYLISESPGRELILRGSFGVFNDTGNSQGSAGFDRFPFVPQRPQANVSLPLVATQVAPPPFDRNPAVYPLLITFDPNLKLPYTLQWNAAAQQSLGTNQTITASYVGNVGRRLLVQRTLVLSPINPKFSSIRLVTNDATSDYHGLQLQFQRRLSRGLQARGAYTWSHAIDVVSSDVVSSLLVRGNSDFDIRHNFTSAVTYDIPILGRSFVSSVFGNWSIDARINAQSALPFNITSGTLIDPSDGTQISRRANLISGVPLYLDDPIAPGGRRFNNQIPTAVQIAAAGCLPLSPSAPAKGAFCTPPTSQSGTLGRNVLRGLPSWQIDFALRRQFRIEKLDFQFRVEAFNVFNHPNFGAINTTLGSTTFGEATNMLGTLLSGLNPLFQVGGPRSFQFALKLSF